MSAMSTAERAKQFLPFAALKGFEEAIVKRQKLDFEPVILGEDAAEELDSKIRALAPEDTVCITYYGKREFNKVHGVFRQLDPIGRSLKLEDTQIKIDDIISIEKENE